MARCMLSQLRMQTVLPSRYLGHLHASLTDPEQRLMATVLEDAIHVYQSFVPGESRRMRRRLAEIEEWLASDDVRDPLAFRRVCAALGIDAVRLREALARWRASEEAFREATSPPARVAS